MAELKIDVVKCGTCGGADKYEVRIFAGEKWAIVKTDGQGPAVQFAFTLGDVLAKVGHDIVYSGLAHVGGA